MAITEFIPKPLDSAQERKRRIEPVTGETPALAMLAGALWLRTFGEIDRDEAARVVDRAVSQGIDTSHLIQP